MKSLKGSLPNMQWIQGIEIIPNGYKLKKKLHGNERNSRRCLRWCVSGAAGLCLECEEYVCGPGP